MERRVYIEGEWPAGVEGSLREAARAVAGALGLGHHLRSRGSKIKRECRL